MCWVEWVAAQSWNQEHLPGKNKKIELSIVSCEKLMAKLSFLKSLSDLQLGGLGNYNNC